MDNVDSLYLRFYNVWSFNLDAHLDNLLFYSKLSYPAMSYVETRQLPAS